MQNKLISVASLALISAILISCSVPRPDENLTLSDTAIGPYITTQILLTSEAGDKMSPMDNQPFISPVESSRGNRVVIQPDIIKQTI